MQSPGQKCPFSLWLAGTNAISTPRLFLHHLWPPPHVLGNVPIKTPCAF